MSGQWGSAKRISDNLWGREGLKDQRHSLWGGGGAKGIDNTACVKGAGLDVSATACGQRMGLLDVSIAVCVEGARLSGQRGTLWVKRVCGIFCKVLVTVLDENDNSPRFSAPVYDVTVPENHRDIALVTLVATDNDAGDNGRVTYTLLNTTLGETAGKEAAKVRAVMFISLQLLSVDLSCDACSTCIVSAVMFRNHMYFVY